MIRLLFNSVIRLILRSKVLSIVKVMGLALGAAIFLLTSLFCLDEFQFDKQHPDYEKVYRYVHNVNTDEGMRSYAFTSAATGPALVDRFPDVTDYTRMLFPIVSVQNPDKEESFNERKFAFADSNFFTFFKFPLRNGSDPGQVLKEPMQVVLTPSASKRYFGSENPVGRSIIVNGELIFTVTGVTAQEPSHSHITFEFIASFSSLEVIKNHPVISQQIPASINLENRGFNAFYTYLMLTGASRSEALVAKFPEFIEEFRGKGRSDRLKPSLQSLASIHLHSELLYEITQNGSARIASVFLIIGFMVLVIACINYVNISTAEFMGRARGVGLKKILGISRSALMASHLFETCVLTILSLLVSCLLVLLMLPGFNSLQSRSVVFFRVETAVIVTGIFVLVVIVSGIYPAISITRFRGMETFRGTKTVKTGSFSLRNALVFFQLLASFCLLTVSLLIYLQVDFLLKKDLGFDATQIMVINATSATAEKRSTLKNLLLNDKNVISVGMCSTPPGESLFNLGINLPEAAGDEDRRISVYQSYVDSDFLHALGVELKEGRFFDERNAVADSAKYLIVNESAASQIGRDVLSRELTIPSIFVKGGTKKYVAGIVEDFSFASLHKAIEPLILEYSPDQCTYFVVRLQTSTMAASIKGIEKRWKETMAFIPFDYSFLDETFANFYTLEKNQRRMIISIAFIAIALAALGIFGTTLFLVQLKIKEVSIRKVLGAERLGIMFVLFKPTFLVLVASCVIGIPVATAFGNMWLSQYPYRVAFSPLLFVFPFLTILIIVIATVLYQFIRATSVNPTDVLRQVN